MSNHNHTITTPPILLTIAGFDPSGGAGIAADLKTFAAHSCYGVAAVTALTVQSTLGVKSVHLTPAATLRAQLEALVEDVSIAAVKIGMLGNEANAAVVAEILDRGRFAHVVLDPVLKSTGGGVALLDAPGLEYLGKELLRRATVVTPNVAEAELLTGMQIKDAAAMEAAAKKLVATGARAVVVKGGHLQKAIDLLYDGAEVLTFGGDHLKSENTHGSGCTFASAIAAQLACGRQLPEAVMLAKAYVVKAIEKGFAPGKGKGALNHFYRYQNGQFVHSHSIHTPSEGAAHGISHF